MRPTFDLPGNQPNRGKVMAVVDAAISLARSFAAGIPLPDNAAQIVNASFQAADEAPQNMFGVAATQAGMAADLVLTIERGEIGLVPARAVMCVSWVGAAADAALSDYQRLLQICRCKFPELGDPIDVSDHGPLGPLWPAAGA